MTNPTMIGKDIAIQRRATGPSRREIDTEKMHELASIGMSQQQISDWFGINLSTFQSNQDWVDIYNEGKSDYHRMILTGQVEIATDPNHRDRNKMLIHLGKTMIGQKETQQIESNSIGTFDNILNILTKNESNTES